MKNLNDSIRLTIDKFIFTFPRDLSYSESGLWIRQEENLARIGLSDFAQQRNGDIAFANVTAAGTLLNIGDEIASIETVKVNISLPSPLRGKIFETNSALEESPELINQDPYNRGWMVILKIKRLDKEITNLMNADAYAQLAKQQADADVRRQQDRG